MSKFQRNERARITVYQHNDTLTATVMTVFLRIYIIVFMKMIYLRSTTSNEEWYIPAFMKNDIPALDNIERANEQQTPKTEHALWQINRLNSRKHHVLTFPPPKPWPDTYWDDANWSENMLKKRQNRLRFRKGSRKLRCKILVFGEGCRPCR